MIPWLTIKTAIGIWMTLGFIGFFMNTEKVSELFVDSWNEYGFVWGMISTILVIGAVYILVLLATIAPMVIFWFFFGV